MRIYLIRHGETDGNAARVLQHPDTPLSVRGRTQAAAVGERMRALALCGVLTSDYARAHDTARAIHDTTGAPLTIRESLRERNLGDLRGTPFAALAQDPFAADFHPPNGESWEQFHTRVEHAWQEVCEFADTADGDFAVVSHALVCRALVERCVEIPDAIRPPRIRFSNTSVTAIDGPPWQVSLLACAAHLDDQLVTYPNHAPGV